MKKLILAFILGASAPAVAQNLGAACELGQNQLSEANRAAINLREHLSDDECAEQYFDGVARFFTGWLNRASRMNTTLDDAAIQIGIEAACQNFQDYVEFQTYRFDRLIAGYFDQCF